jgi:hypothetical protein
MIHLEHVLIMRDKITSNQFFFFSKKKELLISFWHWQEVLRTVLQIFFHAFQNIQKS